MRSQRRRLSVVLSAVTSVTLVAACGSSTSAGSAGSSGSKGSYNISVVSDLTGVTGTGVGIPAADGVEAYIKSVNAAGGVNGRKITMSVFDAQSTVTGSETAFRQALSANAIAVLGEPDFGEPTAGQVFANGQTLFLPTFTYNSLVTKPWYYTVGMDSPQIVSAQIYEAGQLLGGSLTGKKIAIIVAQNPTDAVFIPQGKEFCQHEGCSVVYSDTLPETVTNFISEAGALVSSGAQAVVYISAPTQIPELVSALHSAGFKGPFIGTEGSDNLAVLQSVNSPSYYGMASVQTPTPGTAPYTVGIKYGFGTQNVESSFYSDGWASAVVLVQGLKKCGSSCDGSQLAKAIGSLGTFQVPDIYFTTGPVSFTSSHTLVPSVQFYHLVNGQRVPIGSPVVLSSIYTPANQA